MLEGVTYAYVSPLCFLSNLLVVLESDKGHLSLRRSRDSTLLEVFATVPSLHDAPVVELEGRRAGVKHVACMRSRMRDRRNTPRRIICQNRTRGQARRAARRTYDGTAAVSRESRRPAAERTVVGEGATSQIRIHVTRRPTSTTAALLTAPREPRSSLPLTGFS